MQWVKNPTAMTWVTTEVQVASLASEQWVKNPVLLHLQLGFNPWPGNFHMPWVWPKKIKSIIDLKNDQLYFLNIVKILPSSP